MTHPLHETDELRLVALAELGMLTASLLHEVRQPLFAVKATAELALQGEGPPDAVAWRRILEQARHIEALVSRYGGVGRVEETVQRIDLNASVQQALQMLEPRAVRAGARVHATLSRTPTWVEAPTGALRQVVVNLVQNAIDALDGRAERRVEVQIDVQGGVTALVVRDTGSGIPPEVLARVFEPFVTSKGPEQGTGLGLYITKLLVHRAGGVVQVASEVGIGTTVRVELPQAA